MSLYRPYGTLRFFWLTTGLTPWATLYRPYGTRGMAAPCPYIYVRCYLLLSNGVWQAGKKALAMNLAFWPLERLLAHKKQGVPVVHGGAVV